MSINVSSSGVFNGIGIDGTDLTIPLASIRYGGSTITEAEATGDYRTLMRGIQESYHYFTTGVATGTSNPDDFNKPSYFTETVSDWSTYQSSYLTRYYQTTFYYNIMDDATLVDES
jgi:hypothetical protein